MTTYADLLYEAVDLLDESARRLTQNTGLPIDAGARGMVEQAEKIREALRTRSTSPALSTEDVERIKGNYPYPPTSGVAQDVYALVDSHEAIRRERDIADSVAERYTARWLPMDPEFNERHIMWWKYGVKAEPMTADQIAWFEQKRKP